MKKRWYGNSTRTGIVILQGLLAGLLVFCLAALHVLDNEGYTLGQMGRKFEDTPLFFDTIYESVSNKISYQRNKNFFELDGEYNPDKTVDIRQYMSGALDEASANQNTSYTIQSLLEFEENGREALENRIEELLETTSSDEEAGRALLQDAGKYETVQTVSGVKLSDYASLNVDPAATILEYYQDLCRTALDVSTRYERYQEDEHNGASEDSPDAPSNICYYVENTTTKQRYTNMDVKSYASAKAKIQADSDWTFLFAGERKFNIMTADMNYVLNEDAAQYFMQYRFDSFNEKVLIAVDFSYPVGDSLHEAYNTHKSVRPYIIAAVAVTAVCAVLLVVLLVFTVRTTGREEKNGQVKLNRFDHIPTELAAGIMIILLTCFAMLETFILRRLSRMSFSSLLLIGMIGAACYETALAALTSFVRRIRAHTLWTESVLHTVIEGTSQVYSARKRSQRILIGFTGFVILNLVFVSLLKTPGLIMAAVMDLAVLLYLMRDAVGDENVREGLDQISRGHLDYRINDKVLTGSSREMAAAVNEMGDGLQKAVDDMLKNERLRAELITNVSHDLKTPLTSIINYVDLLKRRNIRDEKAQDYIRILDSKSQRLKTLTEDLIELSKISSGNMEVHPVRLMMQTFLQQACGEFEDKLSENNLTVRMDLDSRPAWVMADGDKLWRVFENMLGNIAKYAKPGSTVDISAKICEPEEKEDAKVRVIFSNESARPITATAQQLQERFVRGDESRSQEGSGLGLSIAKSLTELMGGKFHIEVETDRFTAVMDFPLAEKDEFLVNTGTDD